MVLKLGGLICGAILTIISRGLREKHEVHHLYKNLAPVKRQKSCVSVTKISCCMTFREVITLGFGDHVKHTCARFVAPRQCPFQIKKGGPCGNHCALKILFYSCCSPRQIRVLSLEIQSFGCRNTSFFPSSGRGDSPSVT